MLRHGILYWNTSMQLSEICRLFRIQSQLNPVPTHDKKEALKYFIRNGYNISDSYFTNPKDYKPQMHLRVAECLLHSDREKFNTLGFIFDIDKVLESYLKLKTESPSLSVGLSLDQLIYMLGCLGPSLLNDNLYHIHELLNFTEEEHEWREHLREELIRCDGNITILDEPVTESTPTHRLQTPMEIYFNLSIYLFLRRYVPSCDVRYWKLDRGAIENIRACGLSDRMMLKLTLTYLHHLVIGEGNARITKEMMDGCLQWRNLSNFIDMDHYGDFIAVVFGTSVNPSPLFMSFQSPLESNSYAVRNRRSIVIYALHTLTKDAGSNGLLNTFIQNEKMSNVIDYLWLAKYQTWWNGYTRYPDDKFIIHHHEVIAEFTHDELFDYSKHPRVYTDVIIQRLRTETITRSQECTSYPVPTFVKHLDPTVLYHIPNYHELRWEGSTMHNCAGGYDDECSSGGSVFFHYHDGSRHGYTVELCPVEYGEKVTRKCIASLDEDGDLVRYRLNEINSFANKGADAKVMNVVKKLFIEATMKIEGIENAINRN